MTTGQLIDRFIKNLDYANKHQHINKPYSWALYQTWKYANSYEKNRNEGKDDEQ